MLRSLTIDPRSWNARLLESVRQTMTMSRRLGALAAGLAVLGLIAWFDIATGPHVHIGPLYVVPVVFAAWAGGRLPGHLLGLAATLVWFKYGAPDSDRLLPWTYTVINLAVRGIYYPVVVELIHMVQSNERRLDREVKDRTAELRAEVTERQKTEESLRRLAAELSDAEETERRRVAYDIHDALSQMLGVIKINLELTVAETAIDSRQYTRLTDVVSEVDDLIRQARDLTFDLHPSMLDHFGLGPTLRKFAEDFHRRTMAEVTVSEVGGSFPMVTAVVSYLFRAVKEVVSNAVRHGNAREIIVALHWNVSDLKIVVDDDGSGFDPVAARRPRAGRGLGLAGIDERLTSLGGSLRLESQPGHGARVVLLVPVTKTAAA
jgi:signal transduction histidine kinase